MSKLLAFALLVCLVLGGCAAPMSVPAPASVPTAPQKSGTLRFYTTINTALDELRARGYTVELSELTSSALIAEAMQRGEAEMAGFNSQTMWAAIAKGTDARTVVQRTNLPQIITVQNEITSCDQLHGQSLAVSALTGQLPSLINLYFEENCPGTEPQRLVMPESQPRIVGMVSGELTAVQLQRRRARSTCS
jgi:hypothetical protein